MDREREARSLVEEARRLVEKDGDRARSAAWALLSRARELGSGEAAYAMGTWLLFGVGVEASVPQGLELISEAADRGFARAQHDLAVALMEGDHIPRDVSRALALYRSAAEAGDADAMYALYFWLSGEGCEVFAPEEGHVWLMRAAEAGSTEAQVELAHCYRLGDGVERDASRARELYRSAAAAGDADALAFLAELGDEE